MWSILLVSKTEERDALVAEMWERGTAGVMEESETALRVFFDDASAARQVAQDFPSAASGLREEPEAEPVESEDWEPVLAGEKFVIVPPGRASAQGHQGRIALEVNAAMAFGSGRHETTQFVPGGAGNLRSTRRNSN